MGTFHIVAHMEKYNLHMTSGSPEAEGGTSQGEVWLYQERTERGKKMHATQALPSSTWKKAFALRFLIYSSYKSYILRWENKVQGGQMTCLSCTPFWCSSLSTQFKHPFPDWFVVLIYTSVIRWVNCLGSNPRRTASKVCLSELLKFCSLTGLTMKKSWY